MEHGKIIAALALASATLLWIASAWWRSTKAAPFALRDDLSWSTQERDDIVAEWRKAKFLHLAATAILAGTFVLAAAIA